MAQGLERGRDGGTAFEGAGVAREALGRAAGPAVRQLFEALLTRREAADRAALWDGPAAQAQGIFAADATAEPPGDFAVLHGLYWLTANMRRRHPLVMLIDDLQWCDTPSLRYLAHLLPRMEELGVLIVAALRTGEAATDERLLQQILTDPDVQVLRPHPLSVMATRACSEF